MPQWTKPDCLAALRAAAETIGEPVGYHEYHRWAQWTVDPQPGAGTIQHRFGSWRTACHAAGIDARRPRQDPYEKDEIIDAIIRVRNDLNRWPATSEYRARRGDDEAALTTVYTHFDAWSDAVASAQARAEQSVVG